MNTPQALSIYFFFLVLALPAHAAVVGNGSPQSCTSAALAQAATAGGDITFNCGGAHHVIALQEEIFLAAPGVIDGGGLIALDGQGKVRVLSSGEGDWQGKADFQFTLRNIAIRNGYAVLKASRTDGQGGGVRLGRWNHFIAENVTFEGNVSTEDTSYCVGGGGLYSDEGNTVEIRNSVFRNNLANNGGGINNLFSNLSVTGSTFEGNRAMHSKRINTFQDCGGGGAIYIDGARYINGSEQKSAAGYYEISLQNNTFRNNLTNHTAGAVFGWAYLSQKILIDSSVFEGNQALFDDARQTSKGVAGAVWFGVETGGKMAATAQAKMFIHNSSFVNNHADKMGGAIVFEKPGELLNSTLSGNSALNPDLTLKSDPTNWKRGVGGAIVAGKSTQIIHSTIVYNHTGLVSGGVHAGTSGDQPVLKNSIVAFNSAENTALNKQNCEQPLVDGGGNLQFPQDKTQDCIKGLTAQNPLLQALSSTALPYHALGAGSPASGAGKNCAATDQLRQAHGSCDAGAVVAGTPAAATVALNLANQNARLAQATFTPILSGGQVTGPYLRVTAGQALDAQIAVQPEPAHAGHPAELLLVALYQPPSGAPVFWKRNGAAWQEWDGNNLAHLTTLRNSAALATPETLIVHQGALPGLTGTIRLFAGYILNNELVYGARPVAEIVQR